MTWRILLSCGLLAATLAYGQQLSGESLAPQRQVVGGIKEALLQGVQLAIRELGHDDGFLTNLNVKIPMPKELQPIANTLRLLKQDQLADDLVATMNHAAERAVPEGVSIFTDAISRMGFADAEAIVTGPPDAATQYFRRTTESELYQRFLPLVRNATEATGVTSTYKRLQQTASANKYLGPVLGAFGGASSFDLDGYITQKALDGLFQEIAAEEHRIRQNPSGQASELLRRVFGAVQKQIGIQH